MLSYEHLTPYIMTEEKKDKTKEAKAILKDEQDARVKKCEEEMNLLLGNHNCTFQVSMIVTQERNIPQISIIPLP